MDKMTRVPYGELKGLVEAILRGGYGYSPAEAAITAEVLVEADARSIPSHGVSRLAFYRKNLDEGYVNVGAKPSVVWETPVSLVVDGRGGVGPHISEFCLARMAEKAKAAGVAFCAVRNSNHYGIAGYWAERLAGDDAMGMSFTNTYRAGVPTFGRGRCLGTDPIAVAIPEGNGRRFLLDMATTTVAHGKVEVYDRRRHPMPQGWAVDREGRGVTDATAFEKTFYEDSNFGGHLCLGGEGEESGGHKGYGLNLLVELLCSGLSMGSASFATYNFNPEHQAGICHFFGAIRLDLFGEPAALRQHIAAQLQAIRDVAKAPGHDRIYTHGEKEAESRALALKEGVAVDEPTCGYLAKLAAQVGATLPGALR